jgi:EAL domain-containing protein (putative c-di-GMP-specific phosphodiesterase class I)
MKELIEERNRGAIESLAADGIAPELGLRFQPVLSAHDGRLFAYEAVVSGGRARAAALAEGPHEVGRQLRDLAARAAAQSSVPLFVPISGRDLLDDQLYDPTRPLGRVARRVVLQIEDRPTIAETVELDGRLGRLRRLGFRLAVTDFGAGDGGLSSAPLVWPDFVEIGHPILDLIHQSPARQQVVADLCRLFHQMQMQVVAGGMISAADRAAASALGFDLVHGTSEARLSPAAPQAVRS